MATPGKIVCFGEVLLRLAAPPGEMLLQSAELKVAVGGAEANVAVALARAGVPVAMVSVLPENPLGAAARDSLRRYGVDGQRIRFAPGRMGLYFLTPGAVTRPSQVFYDRAASAFAVAPPDLIDWADELQGASRLHLSGITPALGANPAAAALRAARAAVGLGVPVSFDANYRAALWTGREAQASELLRSLLAESETAFVDHRDISLVLQRPPSGDGPARDAEMAAEAFRAFPKLRRIAFTQRVVQFADRHELVAHLIARDRAPLATSPRALPGIVDRIGAGDAFAAGVLYGLWRGLGDARALDYGLASACLKHSVSGDAGMATAADLEAFLAGGLDVRR